MQFRSCRSCGFDPQFGEIPWRRAWQPTPVFLPGECHRQRSLAGYSPQGRKESDTTEATQHACTYQARGKTFGAQSGLEILHRRVLSHGLARPKHDLQKVKGNIFQSWFQFQKNRKKILKHMSPLTQNGQNNLEDPQLENLHSQFLNLAQSYSNQKRWCQRYSWHIEPWHSIRTESPESPEIKSYIYVQFISHQDTKTIQWGMNSLLNKQYWNKWISTY